jgi:hypothetical protein
LSRANSLVQGVGLRLRICSVNAAKRSFIASGLGHEPGFPKISWAVHMRGFPVRMSSKGIFNVAHSIRNS